MGFARDHCLARPCGIMKLRMYTGEVLRRRRDPSVEAPFHIPAIFFTSRRNNPEGTSVGLGLTRSLLTVPRFTIGNYLVTLYITPASIRIYE